MWKTVKLLTVEICDYLNALPFAFLLCVCVCVFVCVWICYVLWGFHREGPQKALCQCSCRHLNRHETHFQWDTNHLSLSQQRAVLQCQASAISTGISFLTEHWQAFRVSWGHRRPGDGSAGFQQVVFRAALGFTLWGSMRTEPQESKWRELRTNYKVYQRSNQSHMQPYSLSSFFYVAKNIMTRK